MTSILRKIDIIYNDVKPENVASLKMLYYWYQANKICPGEQNQAMAIDTGKKYRNTTQPTSVDAEAFSPDDLGIKATLCVKSRGWSMYPLIHHGDTLYIRPGNADELHTGDVAFFRLHTGSFVVHRLVGKDGPDSLKMNGDSLRDLDEPVLKEQVFGKLTRVDHNGKSLNLEGRFNNLIGRLITQLARHRVPFQITLKQNLARIQWLFGRNRTV